MSDPSSPTSKREERRRAPRVPWVARGRVSNRSTAGTPPFDAFTLDVSEGGLRLSSNHGESLSVEDFLHIALPRPDATEPVQYKARVAWIERPPRQGQGSWSIGCSFFQMPPADVLHLLVQAHRRGGRAQGGSSVS